MIEKSRKVFIMKARPTGSARCICSVCSAYGLHNFRHGEPLVALRLRIPTDIDGKVRQWDRRHPGSEVSRNLSADKAGNFVRCSIVNALELAASVPYLW